MPSKVTKPNTSAQPKLMSIGLDIGKEGRMCAITLVRPEGAKHLWRRVPPSELSIELVADGRRGRVTGLVEAP